MITTKRLPFIVVEQSKPIQIGTVVPNKKSERPKESVNLNYKTAEEIGNYLKGAIRDWVNTAPDNQQILLCKKTTLLSHWDFYHIKTIMNIFSGFTKGLPVVLYFTRQNKRNFVRIQKKATTPTTAQIATTN